MENCQRGFDPGSGSGSGFFLESRSGQEKIMDPVCPERFDPDPANIIRPDPNPYFHLLLPGTLISLVLQMIVLISPY